MVHYILHLLMLLSLQSLSAAKDTKYHPLHMLCSAGLRPLGNYHLCLSGPLTLHSIRMGKSDRSQSPAEQNVEGKVAGKQGSEKAVRNY